jgi:hypothetical protein
LVKVRLAIRRCRAHRHIGASGEQAVTQLRVLAQAFDRHDLALLYAFTPGPREFQFDTGLYVLAASATGVVDTREPSKVLAIDGPVPPDVKGSSWLLDDEDD